NGYWNPGSQSLTVDGSNADGTEMETASFDFDVQAPFATYQNASRVIGQVDFVSGLSRQGGDAASATTLDNPMGAVAYASEEDVLFVSDAGDSRVLGFLGLPEANNGPANFVVGQENFSLTAASTSAAGMNRPESVSTEGGNLVRSEERRVGQEARARRCTTADKL